MKRMAAVAAIGMVSSTLWAATLTVKNFDEDLATVYVNDVATTNGQKVAVDGETKIELKDFRSDYYFRYAPDSQTDRTLALESWEGVPADCAAANPATFDVTGDLTITPNVNVKGYCWTVFEGTKLENDKLFWTSTSRNDAARTVCLVICTGNKLQSTECNLTLDLVERMSYNGKNYTFTKIDARPCFDKSYICQMAIAPKFAEFGSNITVCNASGTYILTNIVGLAEANVTTVGAQAFMNAPAQFNGPATNFVPRTAVTLGAQAYYGRNGMTGAVVLDAVETIGNQVFNNCAKITDLEVNSPSLASIGTAAFSGCSKLGRVSFADGDALTAVTLNSFPSTVTNFTFRTGAPGAATVCTLLAQQTDVDGDHNATIWVNPAAVGWWGMASPLTDAEIGAGAPANCLGVLVDSDRKRRAWIVSFEDVGGTVLQARTGASEVEVLGTTYRKDDSVELTAPAGMSKCELQHLENGAWVTFDSKSGSTVSYTHDGQLTRVRWTIDGAALSVTKKSYYKGTLQVEVKSGGIVAGDNVYSKGSEVWIAAVGSEERPRTAIGRWTGVPAGQETNEVVKLVLNEDTDVTAEFRALEWVYNPTTKKITDGEYTSDARAADLIGETGMSFSAFDRSPDYEPWIDFSIPIYNPDDPTRDYWIAGVTAGRNSSPRNWKRVRFGANVVSMPNYVFIYNSVIDEIEGFGKIRVTDLPGNFFDNSGNGSPLKNRVYEGTDFYPEALKSIGGQAFRDAPSLKGTIRVGLNRLSNINDLIARSEAVTNWIFTAEDLPTLNISSTMFKPTTVTIAATNPVTTTTSTFYYSGDGLKDLIFLAHAPSVASMDLFLTGQSSGSTVIHACKWAPGWKELRMKNPSSCAEWAARPADCWGIYQTANGQKRFYLVRQESKYGPEPGLAVIIR